MSDHDAPRKLFLGPHIRKLRRTLNLTQAQMADGLGISASYLTLIERNQRPLTAHLILRLADAYDVDVRVLAPSTDAATLVGLQDVAADPVLAGADIAASDLAEMAQMFPRVAEAMVRLHEAARRAREDAQALAESASEGVAFGIAATGAVEEAREALQANDNFYPQLEEVAADLSRRAGLRADLPQSLATGLVDHLQREHSVDTVIMPFDTMHGMLRRFDRNRNRLMLSELLPPAGRAFQIAQLAGQLEAGELVRAMASDPRCTSDSARGVYRLLLGNYFAGAIMFPYQPFVEAAERLRYDVEALASRFAGSFEQVAHRLTTLRKPGARGVPMFMLRVDRAGNVSKRFGSAAFPFARSGGTCPRWRLYEAFRTPGRVVVDMAELPDGQTFITAARTTERAGAGAARPGQELVVGLCAEVAHADKLVYADELGLNGRARATGATPIGSNCRLCPRESCNWRAFPPLTGKVVVDVTRRSAVPYHFVT